MIQSFIDGLMNYQFLQYALVTSMLVGLASSVPLLFYVGCL